MSSAFAATGAEQDNVVTGLGSGDNGLSLVVTGKKIRLLSCALVSAGTVTLTFYSDVGGGEVALSGGFLLTANELFVLPLNDGGWVTTAAGKDLNFKLSGAVAVTGVCKTQAIS